MTIQNTFLTTTASNICVGSTGVTAITAMYFCNTSPSATTFSVYLVPAGTATPAPVNLIYNNVLLEAYDTYVIDMEKLMLGLGDTIQAVSQSNNAITASVSYMSM